MYLTNLKVHGFKSFANKTLLDFHSGLTCIVGPNGCGKSNIVDAIRWVLGEQRSAVLRSEKMDNVIFSGSSHAKPLGMAEVSMTIKNTRNILPIEYSEVVVTRRLYRSGDSEYLLNKTPCRLKDIKDLFMDTGVGPDTYSVIELKMVETILSSKSDERLGLFEEAAGINKYKHRRNAAFRKLDATNVDLNRVVDIISEIERNVNSLKRQVSRAERYQALTHEIEELEIRSASLEYDVLLKKLKPLKSELNLLEQNHQQNRTELFREEAGLEKNRTLLLELEDQLTKLQGKIVSLTETLHQKENFVVATEERLKATEEKIQRYSTEQVQLEKRVTILNRRLNEGKPALGLLAEKVDGLRMMYRHKEQELTEFEKVLTRRRLEANESRTRLIELMETINEAEKDKNLLESQILHQGGRKEQLIVDIDSLKKTNEQLSREKNELADKEQLLEKEFRKVEDQLKKKQKLLQSAAEEAEAEREQLLILKNRYDTLKQQRSFFENLIETNEGYPDGIQYLLNEKKSDPGVLGLLADLISVPKNYRLAIEAILGEKAFFVVVKSDSDAYRLMEDLQEKKLGQVTIIVLDKVKNAATLNKSSVPKVAGILKRADDIIQSTKELQPVIQILFGSYLLVRDKEVWQKLPQNEQWFAATLNGEVMAPNGVFRSGRYESEDQVSNLSRFTQLEEITSEISKTKQKIKAVEDKLQKKITGKQQLEQEVADWDQKAYKTREAFQQNRIKNAQRQTTLDNITNNLSTARTELEKTDNSLTDTKNQIQNMKPEIDKLVRKRRRHEDEIEIRQEKLDELETQRNLLADEAHQLNVDLIQTTGEKNGLDSDLKRMGRTLTEFENTIAQRKIELKEFHQNVSSYHNEIKNARKNSGELQQKKETLLSQQLEKKGRYLSLQEEINSKENVLKQSRREGESSADVLQNLKLNISETEMSIQNLQKNIQEKYIVEITPIKAGTADELININRKLETFREKLRLFGGVNLLALEEYKKESERLDFLHRQKNDLTEANQTLLETIQVINKTAHEKFEEVFNQIKVNFRRNFENFFEGGEGDLNIRFDDEDPLSADIIILARPRGKQLGALELLSAGEKALTAIALLFSIYQVKPSPFCILDEVDAPLDDINIHRFLRVLQEFSADTQFIVVTHNKLSMESADNIYGVTMAEEGISKIVSVELNKADDFVKSK